LRSVFIVEDESRTRERLANVIVAAPALAFAGMAATLAAARERMSVERPDVLLLDLGLPDGSGIDLIRWLRADGSERPEILVISVMGDEVSVLGAIEAGAGGYLLKDSADDEVVAAIEQLLAGGAPLSPSIAVHLMRRLRPPATAPAAMPAELSEREIALLRLIAKGLTYEEVGAALGLKYNTVASYAKEIYRKLQVHGRSEAVFEAIQMGLVGGGRP
jgi:DNA-binding NarL/FixJ family response regulator